MLSLACCCTAGTVVTHTVTISNTGNVQLRTVTVATTLTTNAGGNTVTGLTNYSCSLNTATPTTLASPGVTVPQAGVLVCTATYTFNTIGTIEAGNLQFATQVTAADITTQTGTATVTVHQLPQLDVSSSSVNCAEPNPNDESEQGGHWEWGGVGRCRKQHAAA